MLDLASWVLISLGAVFSILGCVGLIRLPDFYSRTHAGGLTDTLGATFLLIGLALQAPHWNVLDDWEPREVLIVEATPNQGHLVSRKVQYYDAQTYAPMLHWQEFYDKKNELWRIENCNYRQGQRDDGSNGPTVSFVGVYDLQRLHASLVFTDPQGRHNYPNAKASDFTPDAIPRLIN